MCILCNTSEKENVLHVMCYQPKSLRTPWIKEFKVDKTAELEGNRCGSSLHHSKVCEIGFKLQVGSIKTILFVNYNNFYGTKKIWASFRT